jgi:hypothetical protein
VFQNSSTVVTDTSTGQQMFRAQFYMMGYYLILVDNTNGNFINEI